MGDSGWVYFEVDGEQEDNEYTRTLIDHCYDQLDYGSWAGEFSASGEAIYDAKENAFVGTDYYSEDVTEDITVNHKIVIPKKLWFDQLQINIEEENSANVQLTLKNGFLIPEHQENSDRITEELNTMVSKTLSDFENETGQDTRATWFDVTYQRSEFTEDGDNLVVVIETYPIGTYDTDEKDIILPLEDL